MASINKKNGSPYWWAWYRDSSGNQTSKSTGILREPTDSTLTQPNYEEAKRIGENFERLAKSGLPANPTPMPAQNPLSGIPTFHIYTRQWITTTGGDEDYHDKLSNYFDNIDDFLGAKVGWPICAIQLPDLVGLPHFLLSIGYSGETVNAQLRSLIQAFKDAIRDGYILACPISSAQFVQKSSPNRPSAMNIAQIECLGNVTRVIDWRTAILFGFYFGMELLPAVNVGWSGVNFQERKIAWTSFNRGAAPIVMSMPMHPVVERHLIAVQKISASEYVTPTLQEKSYNTVWSEFRGLVDASGLPNKFVKSRLEIKSYAFQFTSIKLCFAEQMGHSDLFRLTRYLRLMPMEELAAKIANLPHLNFAPLPLLDTI